MGYKKSAKATRYLPSQYGHVQKRVFQKYIQLTQQYISGNLALLYWQICCHLSCAPEDMTIYKTDLYLIWPLNRLVKYWESHNLPSAASVGTQASLGEQGTRPCQGFQTSQDK
jgi:hypothetical protein